MRFEDWLRGQKTVGTDLSLLKDSGIKAVLDLNAEGSTIPFIARYRKERTGNLIDIAIQNIVEGKERWDEILKRQAFILQEIEKQGKLTDPLKAKIAESFELDLLEDIYLPFKQKRKTKAALAKEAGLEPLAELISKMAMGESTDPAPKSDEELSAYARTFINVEKKVADESAALSGAIDILTERLAETVELRELVRDLTNNQGCLRTKKAEKAKTPSKYENYFDYTEAVKNLLLPKNSHRYLALRRGWIEEELSISFTGPKGAEESLEQQMLTAFEKASCTVKTNPASAHALKAARQALKAYVLPAIESETHKHLKEIADAAAIAVFSENVRNLLMASPFGPKAVLGVDPGIRTGCKLALVNAAGLFMASNVIRFNTDSEKKEAAAMIEACVKEAQLQAIAVGNGTAGRETETFVRQVLKDSGNPQIPVVMVNEAGASIYSASEVAREEFPDLDVTIRGAISIARRLQDPLAELVKIDPKSIGVGQYQHDVNGAQLKRSLDYVVDACVNKVGVNLNTASTHLLARVSGIGPGLAKAVVEFRVSKGVFKSRDQLMEVPRFTKKAFEQAAGFLRIPGGQNPLDNTGVHPEMYPVLQNFAKKSGSTLDAVLGPKGVELLTQAEGFRQEVGEFTFADIVTELEKPGRDPRESFVPFSYRDDIHELKDLKGGMVCPGLVTNVTNFGAFVDIGVHQDGLVHISQLADRFVSDPNEIVKPGDRVTVKVLEVNAEKKQISLTMRSGDPQAAQARPPREPSASRSRSDEGARPPRDGQRRPPRGNSRANQKDSDRHAPQDGSQAVSAGDRGVSAGAPRGDARSRDGNFRGGRPQARPGDRPQRPGDSRPPNRGDNAQGGRPSGSRPGFRDQSRPSRDNFQRTGPSGQRPDRNDRAPRPSGGANFKNNIFGQLENFREGFAGLPAAESKDAGKEKKKS